MIDRQSDAGSWQDALRYTVTIKVSEYPGDTTPALLAPGNSGAALVDPFAAPVLSGDNLLHTER